jgi:hypothetical protein
MNNQAKYIYSGSSDFKPRKKKKFMFEFSNLTGDEETDRNLLRENFERCMNGYFNRKV